MTRLLQRIRSGRIGLLGLILLVLLVLVIAHALIMGVGHDDSEACGSCVVVLLTGLAVITASRTPGPSRVAGFRLGRPGAVVMPLAYSFRSRTPRSTVLRL